MYSTPSTAELGITTDPFARTQIAIEGLQAQEMIAVSHCAEAGVGLPTEVGPETPNLVEAGETAYGMSVRCTINNAYGQTKAAFHVVDVRGVAPERIRGDEWGRRLENGIVITDPSVTHLLINRYFGQQDAPVPGYKGLRPGESIAIGRHLDDKAQMNTMARRFAIYPVVPSRYSATHAEVSLSDDGETLSVVDLGSRYGTWVTTHNGKQPEPVEKGVGHKVLKWMRGGVGGPQHKGPGGEEL